MRYNIKKKRRFHSWQTSTVRLTKSEPVFQLRNFGLADNDFLGHLHLLVDGQCPVEARADVGNGLSRHDKLAVGTEEIVWIQLPGRFVERLRYRNNGWLSPKQAEVYPTSPTPEVIPDNGGPCRVTPESRSTRYSAS